MITLLAAIAEFEKGIMLERQREGIETAKGEGKYKGRKPVEKAKLRQVQALVRGVIVIVPAHIYWAVFSQHMATGTSMAVLLPPIGLAAAFEYYRHGNIDVRAALILAVTMFLGTWVGGYLANQMPGPQLRLIFGRSWRVPRVWCMQTPRLALSGRLTFQPKLSKFHRPSV